MPIRHLLSDADEPLKEPKRPDPRAAATNILQRLGQEVPKRGRRRPAGRPPKPAGPRRKAQTWTRRRVLAALRLFYFKHQRLPTIHDLESPEPGLTSWPMPTSHTVRRYLGDVRFPEALTIAAEALRIPADRSLGIPGPDGQRHSRITRASVLAALARFRRDFGHYPSVAELQKAVRPSWIPSRMAILRALGTTSWAEVKRIANLEPQER